MGITFAARMAMWGAIFTGGGGRDRDCGNVFGILAMAILAPVAAGLLQMALSRSREYEADRSGAELIGTGEPLAGALLKIESYAKQVPMDVDPAHATAYIINPFTGRKVNFANLFMSTADRRRVPLGRWTALRRRPTTVPSPRGGRAGGAAPRTTRRCVRRRGTLRSCPSRGRGRKPSDAEPVTPAPNRVTRPSGRTGEADGPATRDELIRSRGSGEPAPSNPTRHRARTAATHPVSVDRPGRPRSSLRTSAMAGSAGACSPTSARR